MANHFDWNREQEEMDKFNRYTAVIEGLKINFIHERSEAEDAIPLLLVHGWPGSFLAFVPVINERTQDATTAAGKNVY